LRTLFPPKAMPELQSSRFAQISTPPPRCSDNLRSAWMGDAPNNSGVRGKSSRLTGFLSLELELCRVPSGALQPYAASEKQTIADEPLTTEVGRSSSVGRCERVVSLAGTYMSRAGDYAHL
jgi:hypothetical protein